MRPIYVIDNLINDNTPITYDTKDSLYIPKNLYNERPSLPYRTASKHTPEWVCVEFTESTEVTFVGLFNHNLTTPAESLTLLKLWGGNACEEETCETDLTKPPVSPCEVGDCTSQPIADFRNTWSKVDCDSYKFWTLQITDNPTEAYYEIGELVLGVYKEFPRGVLSGSNAWVRLTPGRADGPEFFMGNQRTHYGQDWSTYYSECERFELKFTVQNDPCLVDYMHTFLKDVQQAGGRFVLVPDDDKPFCYYVIIENLRDYAERTIYGRSGELREWRLRLKSLTEGVSLI